MSMTIVTIGQYKIVEIPSGPITQVVIDDIRDAVAVLLANGEKHVVLDFSQASTLDSKMLGVIGTMYGDVIELQGTLGVILKNDDMTETLNLSGLNLLVRQLPDRKALTGGNEHPTELKDEELTGKSILIRSIGIFKVLKTTANAETVIGSRELSAAALRLIDGGHIWIAFDFSDILRVSSHILTAVAIAYQSIRASSGTMCIITQDDGVRDLLAVSGMDTLISIVKNENELIERFKPRSSRAVKQSILIVDDSAVMRELLQKQVMELGYDAFTASNGKEAVKEAISRDVQMVLMDVTMPEMDGYEACKAIKNQLCDTHMPIIFVTNLQEPSERLNALNAGGDDFINKPVQREDLLFRIRTHLKIKQLMADLRNMNENLEKLITEKTNTLMETERQLYQAEKMSTIGTMLSGIAHELKNPIFVIGSWAQMLKQRGKLDDDQLKGIDFIQSQAVRCAAIVENLLKLVRKKVEEVQFLDLNEIIDNIRLNLNYLVTGKSIEVTTDLQAKGHIQGNAAEIEQIIINLVSNSVDAIDERGNVTIRTRDDRTWCVIEVEDNGCGMTEKVRRRIFDPFFTTKEAGKGTGLGMSIIYKIVQVHRGRISVKSEPAKGTTVSVYFPTLQS